MLIALLAAVVALAALPAGATASFPGKQNGRIVIAVQGCEESRRLVSMPWEGGPLRRVTPACEIGNDGFSAKDTFAPDAWSDGGGLIAVQRNVNPGIVRMTAKGRSRLVAGLPASVQNPQAPSLAPNGKRFAFTDSSGGIRTARIKGTGLRRLTPRCEANCAGFTDPRWSPDGKLIAARVVHRGTVPRSPKPSARGIWLIRSSDGRPVRRIAKRGGDVDWAPDSRSLVYATGFRRNENGHAAGGDLYRVGRDGRNVRRLVRRRGLAEVSPSWSPDTRSIVWISLDLSGAGDVFYDVDASLWRVRARGGVPERIRSLPAPRVDGGFFDVPSLTWLPRV